MFGESITRMGRAGIYRDEELVPLNSLGEVISPPPSNYSQIRTLRVANESAVPVAIVGMSPWDSFSTEISMGQGEAAYAWKQPQFSFPFDSVSHLVT
jgi:hypothetical protein